MSLSAVGRVLSGVAMLAMATSAHAQSNDEVFPQFQFNFSTPGARANAMGRAFIGLADDASASITNPAGLVRLTRRQAYLEFKTTDLTVDRLSATQSLFTLDSREFGSTVNSVGFLSFSMPFGDRFAFAFTRHEFLNHKEEFTLDPRPVPETASTFFGVDGETDFTGVTYAGSVAVTLSDQFRAGLTVGFDTLKAESVATRFRFNQLNDFDQFAVEPTGIVVNETAIDESASGVSLIGGILILPNDKLSLGVSFAIGSTLEVDEGLYINPSDTENLPLELADEFPKRVTINVPNRIGFGAAFRPTSRLLAAFDVVYIGYSSLAKDFTLIFSNDVLEPGDFEVDNAVEVHAGAEYLLIGGDNPLFVRGGVHTSPNHATRFLGAADPLANATETAKYNLLPRDTDVVGTAGAGISVGRSFQLDFAYVFGREFVASAAFRF